MQWANQQDLIDVQLLVKEDLVDLAELDSLYHDVLNKIEHPPYDRLFLNLSQQRFSQSYQTVRQLL